MLGLILPHRDLHVGVRTGGCVELQIHEEEATRTDWRGGASRQTRTRG
jgi:hypothetical protein